MTPLSFSFCQCTINLVLYRSLSVPGCFIAEINLHLKKFASDEMFFLLLKANEIR